MEYNLRYTGIRIFCNRYDMALKVKELFFYFYNKLFYVKHTHLYVEKATVLKVYEQIFTIQHCRFHLRRARFCFVPPNNKKLQKNPMYTISSENFYFLLLITTWSINPPPFKANYLRLIL